MLVPPWEAGASSGELPPVSAPLPLVRLTSLMELCSGNSEIVIGLLDGPVAIDHPDLATASVRGVASGPRAGCSKAGKAAWACAHGTFTAGILSAKRNSSAPAICPECTLLVRPIFEEKRLGDEAMPSADPRELARAIPECIEAGARVLNLSVAFA